MQSLECISLEVVRAHSPHLSGTQFIPGYLAASCTYILHITSSNTRIQDKLKQADGSRSASSCLVLNLSLAIWSIWQCSQLYIPYKAFLSLSQIQDKYKICGGCLEDILLGGFQSASPPAAWHLIYPASTAAQSTGQHFNS